MKHRMPLFLLLGGLTALFVSERSLADMPRYLASGAGLALFAAAFIVALLRRVASAGDRRAVAGVMLGDYALVGIGLALYVASTDVVGLVPAGKGAIVVMVLWPASMLLGLLPLVAKELTWARLVATPTLERWRLERSSQSARIVALAILAFAGMNYAASVWNRKIDVSYFKTTKPGEATLNLVRGLVDPVEVLLFFSPGNDVLEQVRHYVDTVALASQGKLTARIVDQALDVELSRDLKVKNNGVLVLRTPARHEQLRLGLDLEDARSELRSLDADFQERLLKVIRPPRIAYFTMGHGERDWVMQNADKRLNIMELRLLFESQGFTVRRMGLTDGLGTDLPSDTSVLVTVDPTEAFMDGELAAIRRHLEKGGRWMVFLDPQFSHQDAALTGLLGVQVARAFVAHDKYLLRIDEKGESPYNMATTQGTTHPAASTIQGSSERLFVAMLGAGAVTKLGAGLPGLTYTPVLKTMSQAWEDVEPNGKPDEGKEKRGQLEIVQAVSGKLEGKEAELRAVVYGDADLVGSGIVRNGGNMALVLDSLRWLAGDEKAIGKVESERDEPIVHRKDKDTIWFYGTSFLFPALVLGVGLVISRRTRGKKEG